jgi:hypothetical protein
VTENTARRLYAELVQVAPGINEAPALDSLVGLAALGLALYFAWVRVIQVPPSFFGPARSALMCS